MRFAVIAATFLASAISVSAQESTVYLTDVVTITSCHPTVTNCPARSTVYVPSGESRPETGESGIGGDIRTYQLARYTSTTSYPVITSSSAAVLFSNTSIPATTATWVPPPVSLSTAAGVTSEEVVTVTVLACAATSTLASVVTVSGVASSTIASTGVVTAPTSTGSPIAFAGAASVNQVSFGLGAVALAAFFL